MTAEQLTAMIRAVPFRPFSIDLTEGREVVVSHPDAIAYRGGRIAPVAFPNGHFEIIDLLLAEGLKETSEEQRL